MTRVHEAPSHASPADVETRAPDLREHVRTTLDGPDLLPAAAEDCCTWFGYPSILLCRVERIGEDHSAGR